MLLFVYTTTLKKVCNVDMQVFQIKLKYHCSKPINLQKFLMQQYNYKNVRVYYGLSFYFCQDCVNHTLVFVGFFNSFVSGHEPWDVNIIISFQGLKGGQQLGVACVRTPTPAINQSKPCVAGIFAMQSNTYYILCVVAFFVFEVRQ